MKVAVIGSGITKFKEHWDKGFNDLISEASGKVFENANIKSSKIDSLYVSNVFSSVLNGQSNLNVLCSNLIGVKNSTLISGSDACGAIAIKQAALSILSGQSKTSMVIGVEKMSDLTSNDVDKATTGLIDQDFEAFYGVTLPSLYALIAKKYIHHYKLTRKQLSLVSVKNHKNAVNNPIAMFPFEISAEAVEKSPLVADPLTMLDCYANADGCAAIILCREDLAREYCKKPVYLIGSGQSSDSLRISERENLTEFKATKEAARAAYEIAKVSAKDVNVAEVHDAFSISEIIALEDLGFVKKGEAGKFIEKGFADINSKISVNPSGGIKACGHAFGATGIKQTIEIVNQLRERCGERQVKDAKIGLTHTLGGSGSTAVVNIFSRQ